MNIYTDTVGSLWLLLAAIAFISLWGYNLLLIPWGRVRRQPQLQHLSYALAVVVTLFWTMRMGTSAGLGMHFILMSVVYHMVGVRLGLLILLPISLVSSLIAGEYWLGFAVNAWIFGVWPLLIVFAITWWVKKKAPANPFVFIFVACFFSAIVTILATAVAQSLFAWWFMGVDGYYLKEQYWMFMPLLALPEGIINGMWLASLVAFKPEWLRAYHDQDYLPPKD